MDVEVIESKCLFITARTLNWCKIIKRWQVYKALTVMCIKCTAVSTWFVYFLNCQQRLSSCTPSRTLINFPSSFPLPPLSSSPKLPHNALCALWNGLGLPTRGPRMREINWADKCGTGSRPYTQTSHHIFWKNLPLVSRCLLWIIKW